MKKFLILSLVIGIALILTMSGCEQVTQVIGSQPVMYVFDGHDFSTYSNWSEEIPGLAASDVTNNDWEFYLEISSLNYKVPGAGLDGFSQYRVYVEWWSLNVIARIKMWGGTGENYDAVRVVRTPIGTTVDLTTVTTIAFVEEFNGIIIDLR